MNKVLRSLVVLLSGSLLVFAALVVTTSASNGFAEDSVRKVKIRVYPAYPEIARRMSLTGAVRLEVVVAANGTVKETKVIGGHPILAAAAVEAVKKWRFDPASAETTETLEVKFDPGN